MSKLTTKINKVVVELQKRFVKAKRKHYRAYLLDSDGDILGVADIRHTKDQFYTIRIEVEGKAPLIREKSKQEVMPFIKRFLEFYDGTYVWVDPSKDEQA